MKKVIYISLVVILGGICIDENKSVAAFVFSSEDSGDNDIAFPSVVPLEGDAVERMASGGLRDLTEEEQELLVKTSQGSHQYHKALAEKLLEEIGKQGDNFLQNGRWRYR